MRTFRSVPFGFLRALGARFNRPSGWLVGLMVLLACQTSIAAPGAFDPTFNGTGKIVTEFGTPDDKG